MWKGKMRQWAKDDVYRMKKKILKNEPVDWVAEYTRTQLLQLWNSKEYQDRNKQAKKNKSKGAAKYTLGSVSYVHVSKELSKSLKRPCSEIQLFEKTHMKKGSSSASVEMELVDDRAREMRNTYYRRERELMVEYRASQEPDTPLTKEQESILKSQTYLESTGCKKGCVYGIGSVSSLYYSNDSLSSSSHACDHASSAKVLQLEGEVANNKAEIEVLKGYATSGYATSDEGMQA